MIFKSDYSVLSSAIKIENAITEIKKNYKSAMIADDHLFGVIDFWRACVKNDIKPVISQEITIKGLRYLLVAKNGKGYKELKKIVSLKKFKYSEDIYIILVGYENISDIQNILNINFIGVNNSVTFMKNKIEQKVLKKLAKERGIKMIPYQPANYINDTRALKAVIAVGQEKNIDSLKVETFSLLSKEDMLKNYGKELTKNLADLVNSCSIEGYEFGNPVPPSFAFAEDLKKQEKLPLETTEDQLFVYMCEKGLQERLKKVSPELHEEYKKRLSYEMEIIKKMKFSGYMLIVQDLVQIAKKESIPVGPGRGSAAGSLVAYALEITDIDPIPHGLLFERFLNPERISMPDIDIDFCQSNRQKILDLVSKKYGQDKVSQTITFGTFAAKGSIRDASRILGYPLQKADHFAKIIPEIPGITLEKAYKEEKEKIDQVLKNPDAKRVWEYAQKLEGLKRNLGVHASAVVISNKPIYEKAPLTKVNGTQVVQFAGDYLEEVDLIKFDFLGLKTLSVIHEALNLIKKNHGVEIDFSNIDLTDKSSYELISTGHTTGLFQLESDGMRKLCSSIKPSNFEELTAILALYRPGPMESGMVQDFIDRKNGVKPVEYFFDDFKKVLEPILKPTYGVIVYQEQVMKIVQEVGGFSLAEADLIRRAMGKKKIKYMEEKAKEFAEGATKKGLNKDHAKKLFELIEKFAGYGFNKSHSAAYAQISYQTAYLKSRYPAELLTALANLDIKDQDKLSSYIQEAQRLGLEVKKPDINNSPEIFETDGKSITFGLKAIKGVGSGADSVLLARTDKFISLKDFLTKTRNVTPKLNKRVFEALIFTGVLDSFGVTRKAMIENSKELLDLKEEAFEKVLKETEEYSTVEKLRIEKDKMGMYLTDPFSFVKKYIKPYHIPNLDSLPEGQSNILVFPEEIISRKAKKTGKEFGILTGYYNGVSVDILAFNSNYGNVFSQLKEANLDKPIICKVTKKEDGGLFLSELKNFTNLNLESSFKRI
jgi:DNA polymerase-3 subunit alpha